MRHLLADTARTLPCALVIVAACGGGESRWAGTSTDSAGVMIVENAGTVPLDDGGWGIAPAPDLAIGAGEGDTTYQFFGIAGAHRTAEGQFVVVNAGSRDVRVYDARGTFLRSFGRSGGGPEEFEAPVLGGVVNDTLIVVDRAHHRISMVHADAGIVRVMRVADEVGAYLNPVGAFHNGEVVFGGALDMGRTQFQQGLNRAHTFYRSCRPDGSLAADFGPKMGADFFIQRMGPRGPETPPAFVPFGRMPVATVSPDRFYFSSQDTWEIEAYEPSGTLVRLIRLDRDPAAVTDEHTSRYIEGIVGDIPGENGARMRQMLSEIPVPHVFPPYGELAADALGYLWVADYAPPGDERSTWTIFDPDGRLSGRVTAPPGISILEIGEDYLLGVYRDELDVEYLHQYAVSRPH
ncbi:MAG: hypothetical protein OEO20_17340 [Gemmatimonadota bacterium]|nr:hypothetical protein [Gemmatimonadota bacterium]MDH3480062.1 hypothetical protein [Gemmatimonadota bacterium]MDH3570785.1 hypothetical protein [Gemmatimonadota bacterium]MDH5550912.1 hypothetical protein [Gemmatimonadota bacterium]